MRKPPLFSVDTRGLTFFAKSALVVTLTFVGVQYGTALGYEQLLPGSNDARVAADAAHENTVENFPAPTFEEAQVLTELENFEEQLSTRTIASPSVESLAQAHHKFIAADLGNMKLYLFEDGHATATLPILSNANVAVVGKRRPASTSYRHGRPITSRASVKCTCPTVCNSSGTSSFTGGPITRAANLYQKGSPAGAFDSDSRRRTCL